MSNYLFRPFFTNRKQGTTFDLLEGADVGLLLVGAAWLRLNGIHERGLQAKLLNHKLGEGGLNIS